MNTAEYSVSLTAEMLTFNLLGKILYEYPEAEWIKTLVVEGVFNEFPGDVSNPEVAEGMALLQKWAQMFDPDNPGPAFDALVSDYNRLFVGPGKLLAAPWESVYSTKERLIFDTQTLEVRNWYRRFGLELEKIYQEPDDHIGLELIFLSHLAKLGLEAIEEQNDVEFKRLSQARAEFLREHPLKWVDKWSKDVLEKAQTDFFRGIALLVRGVFRNIKLELSNSQL